MSDADKLAAAEREIERLGALVKSITAEIGVGRRADDAFADLVRDRDEWRERATTCTDRATDGEYLTFDSWFNEVEGFSLRAERCFEDVRGDIGSLAMWLEAAWKAGRGSKDDTGGAAELKGVTIFYKFENDALDGIANQLDAAMFTGDVFVDDTARDMLRKWMARWERGLKRWDDRASRTSAAGKSDRAM